MPAHFVIAHDAGYDRPYSVAAFDDIGSEAYRPVSIWTTFATAEDARAFIAARGGVILCEDAAE
jgi:hypothetical protein